MSNEDEHYPSNGGTFVPYSDIAKVRQALYDAKLLLSQGGLDQATQKIIEALDVTTRWPA